MIIFEHFGLSWPWSYSSWIYNYLCNRCISPLMLWVRIPLRARCTKLCDKVCQWLAASRWFSQGTPVSSTNKTVRHNRTEIVLKVALNTLNPKPKPSFWVIYVRKSTVKQITILKLWVDFIYKHQWLSCGFFEMMNWAVTGVWSDNYVKKV